jgi:hypothetical protein
MTVFVCSLVDQTFNKKSAEVAYIANVLGNIAAHLQKHQGTSAVLTNVTANNALGVSGVVATYTYTSSATNP